MVSVKIAVGTAVAGASVAWVLWRFNQAGPNKGVFAKLLGLSMEFTVDGEAAPGFEAVREAFESNFSSGHELSSQCAIFVRGDKVVDLAGTTSAAAEPYDRESLQIIWSCSKTITAVVVAVLVRQGKLDYDVKISSYWPAFAQQGKGDLTVGDLMRHETGLDMLGSKPIDKELFTSLATQGSTDMMEAIEQAPAEWDEGHPGTKRSYHAVTRGLVINELVKKVTGGRTVGAVLRDITDELGISASMRLGISAEERASLSGPIAPLHHHGSFTKFCRVTLPVILGTADTAFLEQIKFFGKGSWAGRRMMKATDFGGPEGPEDGPGFSWREWYIASESPSTNVHTNARSMAALMSQASSLIGEEALAKALVCTKPCLDTSLGITTQFCAGGWCRNQFGRFPLTGAEGRGWFGWAGWGGSVILFNPDLDVALAYAMTSMEPSLTGDPRAAALIAAMERCLIAQGVAAAGGAPPSAS